MLLSMTHCHWPPKRRILSCTRHGILRKNLIETIFESKSGGALDPDVGRDAAQDNGCDAPPSQRRFKFCPVKSTPLMFGNHEVARFRPHFRNNLGPIWRRGLRWPWCVNEGTQHVFAVRRKCHPHQEYWHPVFSERGGNCSRIFYDAVCCMGSGLPPNDALLKINDDQRRPGPVNECLFHAQHIATFQGQTHQNITFSPTSGFSSRDSIGTR